VEYEIEASIDAVVIAVNLLVASLHIDDREAFVIGFRQQVELWRELRMREPLPESYFQRLTETAEEILEGNDVQR
jgi:hypothetical protein